MPLIASLQVVLNATLTKTPGLTVPATNIPVNRIQQLTSGVGAGQADRLYAATRTLGASATEDLDLAGVLTDDFAQVITFARIKMLYVAASAANTNNVVVGAAAATPWTGFLTATGTMTYRPGTWGVPVAVGAADATGYVVGAGAADFLRVANSAGGTSVTYDIAIIGTST
jgi:hypothetical protein